jgi:hypothetical protein
VKFFTNKKSQHFGRPIFVLALKRDKNMSANLCVIDEVCKLTFEYFFCSIFGQEQSFIPSLSDYLNFVRKQLLNLRKLLNHSNYTFGGCSPLYRFRPDASIVSSLHQVLRSGQTTILYHCGFSTKNCYRSIFWGLVL